MGLRESLGIFFFQSMFLFSLVSINMSFGGFGATTAPAGGGFGGFGASSSAAAGGFGGFGGASSSAAAGGFGGFGASSSSAGGFGGFGAGSSAATGIGGFGASSSPAGGFGATGIGGFGAGSSAATGLGGFGSTGFGSTATAPATGAPPTAGNPSWDWTLQELQQYSASNPHSLDIKLLKDLYSRRVAYDSAAQDILSKVSGRSSPGEQAVLERLRHMSAEVKSLREGPESAMQFLRHSEQLRVEMKGQNDEGGIKATIRELRDLVDSCDVRCRSDPSSTSTREVQQEHDFVIKCADDMVTRVEYAGTQLRSLQREMNSSQSGGSISSQQFSELVERHYKLYTWLNGRMQEVNTRIDPLREHYRSTRGLPPSFFESLQVCYPLLKCNNRH